MNKNGRSKSVANTAEPQGKGQKTSAVFDFECKIEADGKVLTDVKGHYALSMQFESIDYLVKDLVKGLASSVANVASRIAEDKAPEPIEPGVV